MRKKLFFSFIHRGSSGDAVPGGSGPVGSGPVGFGRGSSGGSGCGGPVGGARAGLSGGDSVCGGTPSGQSWADIVAAEESSCTSNHGGSYSFATALHDRITYAGFSRHHCAGGYGRPSAEYFVRHHQVYLYEHPKCNIVEWLHIRVGCVNGVPCRPSCLCS